MDEHLLNDIFLTRRVFGAAASDSATVDFQNADGDLKLARGRANLGQAIVNRLFTRQGELAPLGHPQYGSRLFTLAGEPHNRRTRALAELYIHESLARERRIQEIIEIRIEPRSSRATERNLLQISVFIVPAHDREVLAVSTILNLEG